MEIETEIKRLIGKCENKVAYSLSEVLALTKYAYELGRSEALKEFLDSIQEKEGGTHDTVS